MEFIQIKDAQSERANRILMSYSSTFPEDERRSNEQFQKLFSNEKVNILGIFRNQIFVGYAVMWQLSDFGFMEHFEIFPEFQNQQLGSLFLKNIVQKQAHLVLETEPENLNDDAVRRLKFYQKNSFYILQKDYVQPAYSAAKNPLTLWLMANYHPERLEFVKENIYDVVYR